MKENVGRKDRIARSVIGPALMILGFTWIGRRTRWPGLLALVAGTAVLESAVTRVCPLNAAIGVDTTGDEGSQSYELGEVPKEAPQPLLPQI